MTLRDYLYYEEPGITLYCGDALAVLAAMPDASAQTCITYRHHPQKGQRYG